MSSEKFVTAEELISAKKYSEAAAELEKIRPSFLTPAEAAELGRLFALIPEEVRAASPAHCLQEMELAQMLGHFEVIGAWYARIISMRERYKEGTQARAALEDIICWAKISRPDCDNARLLMMLAVLYHEGAGSKANVRLDPTAGLPSVLRGRKDLSVWSQTCGAVISIITPMVNALYGGSQSFTSALRAEMLYERGDISGAAQAVAGTLSTSDPGLFFAGHALLARIKALSKNCQSPSEVLDSIGKKIDEQQALWLERNYRALLARFSLLGDGKFAAEWFQNEAPDELTGIAPNQYYCALTKAVAYIQLGRYSDAVTLAEILQNLLKNDLRPLDTADCLALEAVACFLSGGSENAFEKLEAALALTEDYGFVQFYAEYGAPMAGLLRAYIAARSPSNGTLRYINKILAAADEHVEAYSGLNGKEPAEKPAPKEPAEKPAPKEPAPKEPAPKEPAPEKPAPKKKSKKKQ